MKEPSHPQTVEHLPDAAHQVHKVL